jgi:uroporphyrinogen-III decarboxylase
VRETVRGLIRDIAPGGRYLVTSGNSVASYCDPDNVMAMGEAVQELGRYPIAV